MRCMYRAFQPRRISGEGGGQLRADADASREIVDFSTAHAGVDGEKTCTLNKPTGVYHAVSSSLRGRNSVSGENCW